MDPREKYQVHCNVPTLLLQYLGPQHQERIKFHWKRNITKFHIFLCIAAQLLMNGNLSFILYYPFLLIN